ncbi:TetR/AcrR family transcriptional regulator [Streptomyces alfalfae]|uniref:TetR/AcrR family transcriptional regulator n=1 Tax=Streptomyces alfalfae TaxID=1642299 RepID=A0A7T4TYD6_9ACTN|nr:TetR/AcrR family transcriptional regulator [Streptomyces alfalfae]QQC90090.1 TetR/AcrR family transcriptional regulator [Streptomyces alfalfae]
MPDIKHFDPDEALDRVVRLFWEHGAATTSIQAVATATGLNRSSLYATFGGKRELYLAALRRYLRDHSHRAFAFVAEDGRGLPAIREFFAGLIELRCTGPYAGWGCMAVNAHAGGERDDPEVRGLLDDHHERLRGAMRTALLTARSRGDLSPGADVDAAAETLALLAYGVNLRSRAGAEAAGLRRTVDVALGAVGATGASG